MLMHQRAGWSGLPSPSCPMAQIGDDDGDELEMIIENIPFVRKESDNMYITENL